MINKYSKLILLRHGQSVWNKEAICTGWFNIGLHSNGKKESIDLKNFFKNFNLIPNVIYTSDQKRALETRDHIFDCKDSEFLHSWFKFYNSWRLNERHYGDFTGENKYMIKQKYNWNNDFCSRPVDMHKNYKNDFFLKDIPSYSSGQYGKSVIKGESLEMVHNRLVPYFNNHILHSLNHNKVVLIISHKNTLKVLINYLENNGKKQNINHIKIHNSSPIVYEFDKINKIFTRLPIKYNGIRNIHQ